MEEPIAPEEVKKEPSVLDKIIDEIKKNRDSLQQKFNNKQTLEYSLVEIDKNISEKSIHLSKKEIYELFIKKEDKLEELKKVDNDLLLSFPPIYNHILNLVLSANFTQT